MRAFFVTALASIAFGSFVVANLAAAEEVHNAEIDALNTCASVALAQGGALGYEGAKDMAKNAMPVAYQNDQKLVAQCARVVYMNTDP